MGDRIGRVANIAEYRRELYASYASCVKCSDTGFDADRANRWAKAYRWYLRSWLPGSPDAAILDVGCGAGWMLHFLAGRGYRNLRGVDVSAEQVALSRQVVDNVAHAEALAYLDAHPAQFDLILALDILEHFTKPETLRFLKVSMLALRPGGRLILQTPNPESPYAGGIIFGDFTHEHTVAPAALAGLLRVCGFQDIRLRETGPAPRAGISVFRWLAWKCLRLGMLFANYIETGGPGSGIFTRVYLTTASKSTVGG